MMYIGEYVSSVIEALDPFFAEQAKRLPGVMRLFGLFHRVFINSSPTWKFHKDYKDLDLSAVVPLALPFKGGQLDLSAGLDPPIAFDIQPGAFGILSSATVWHTNLALSEGTRQSIVFVLHKQ